MTAVPQWHFVFTGFYDGVAQRKRTGVHMHIHRHQDMYDNTYGEKKIHGEEAARVT